MEGENKDFSMYSNPDNDFNGDWCSADPSAKSGTETTRFGIENPYTKKIDYPPLGRYWAFSKATMQDYIKIGKIKFKENYKDGERGFVFKRYKKDVNSQKNPLNSLFADNNEYMNQKATTELTKILNSSSFSYPKPVDFIKILARSITKNLDIILDFFSGSATTAHAVMQLNAEDGGNRKFIMVQLPEKTDEKSEAYKAGYKNICEIGKERIRRAGKKIVEEQAHLNTAYKQTKLEQMKPVAVWTNSEEQIKEQDKVKKNLDIGFRVLKLDCSNMKDVYYNPADISQDLLSQLESNIKEDRSSLDLLFQVMLDMGVMLSQKIEKRSIQGKTVYIVGEYDEENQPNLICCFDDNISEDVVTTIAKLKPIYAVFRDSSMSTDSMSVNFDQIFATHSPNTTRKVL